MAQPFRFNNLPRELRVQIWNMVPLQTTRREIRVQHGRVQLITQGVDGLRLVCRMWNDDIRRFIMFRGHNIIYRGPNVASNIPRLKIVGGPWGLLAERHHGRWQGIVIAAMDWFAVRRLSMNAPLLAHFNHWLRTANRLGPVVGGLPVADRNAIIKWVYQTGYILARNITNPGVSVNHGPYKLLVMGFLYNIPLTSPGYTDPQNIFYPCLQRFAHEIGMIAEAVHTAAIDDDLAVTREFNRCDRPNALLKRDNPEAFWSHPAPPDLAFWRDFVVLAVPNANAGPLPPLAPEVEIVSGEEDTYSGETWEGSVEEYVKGWGRPM